MPAQAPQSQAPRRTRPPASAVAISWASSSALSLCDCRSWKLGMQPCKAMAKTALSLRLDIGGAHVIAPVLDVLEETRLPLVRRGDPRTAGSGLEQVWRL